MVTKRRIVIKLGTNVLTGGTHQLNRPGMVEIVRQCAFLHEMGHEVILCSSGAITAGRERLNHREKPKSVMEKQMFAAVGQSRLMLTWERLFEIYSIHVGQILLAHGDMEIRNRFLNARDTLQALIKNRIIPIINENDAVATEEIRRGNNDNLSALVAVLAEADTLILLTDQQGLYTADPRSNPDAALIPVVEKIDDSVKKLAGGSGTNVGTGGMVTKIEAAEVACRAGTQVIIACGSEPDVLLRLIRDGESLGTSFPPRENPVRNRKLWLLAANSHPAGYVMINQQAVQVLQHQKGRSLLPAGIMRVAGEFTRGDVISICDESGQELARGIARYHSIDMGRIAGYRSDEIEAILGYVFGPVAVHRNDMVLL